LKPLPIPTPDTAEWFRRSDAGEFTIPKCASCGAWFLYPRSNCPKCYARNVQLVASPGLGKVASFVINHRAPEGFQPPYVLALVDLVEGPRLTGVVKTDRPDDVEVGTPVRVAFEPRGERQVICFELEETA
jgi:uncharacterized OB-fold protein